MHARRMHGRFFWNLELAHVQLDEFKTRLRGETGEKPLVAKAPPAAQLTNRKKALYFWVSSKSLWFFPCTGCPNLVSSLLRAGNKF